MKGTFKRLAYVYVGTSDFDGDLRYYRDTLGAKLLWNRTGFGARVAAFDLCGEPYLLIADHIKPPSKRLIYEVEDLEEAARALKGRGREPQGEGSRSQTALATTLRTRAATPTRSSR